MNLDFEYKHEPCDSDGDDPKLDDSINSGLPFGGEVGLGVSIGEGDAGVLGDDGGVHILGVDGTFCVTSSTETENRESSGGVDTGEDGNDKDVNTLKND